MSYKVKRYSDAYDEFSEVEFDTMLSGMDHSSIFLVKRLENGNFHIAETLDGWHAVELTLDQYQSLIAEMQALIE